MMAWCNNCKAIVPAGYSGHMCPECCVEGHLIRISEVEEILFELIVEIRKKLDENK